MSTTGIISLLGAAVLTTAAACHRAATRTRSAQEPDSAAAVSAAVIALEAVPQLGRGSYRVVRFRRDSAGVLVGLQRTDATVGGGGLVRVSLHGFPVVRELWQ